MFVSVMMSTEITPGTAADFDFSKILSIQWWLQHLADSYAANPLHMLTEFALVLLILYLFFAPEKKRKNGNKLTAREEQQLIDEWEPEPLVPSSFTNSDNEIHSRYNWHKNTIHIQSALSNHVLAIDPNKNSLNNNTKEYIQFASHNYLGFANLDSIKEKCISTLKTYAVGSCGPRGFYGTMDIHLNLEKSLSEYFGGKIQGREAIIYADNIGCCASVITAFAKRGDLLLIDEGCHYLVTQGAILSRANVIWYPHNDMKALESYLQTVQEEDERHNRPLNRRYIVTEGLFHNHGDIAKLQEICRLKEEYKYRLILDDSHGLGVLDVKGSPGYWGIEMKNIDIYISSMDCALGSTGGFCVGDHETIYHQTLSGAGYVFSASAPPFQCTAVIESLKILNTDIGKEYIKQLQNNAIMMRELLVDGSHGRWIVNGDNISPLIHLRLTNNIMGKISEEQTLKLFEKVCLYSRNLKDNNILIFPTAYLPQEYGIPEKSDPKPSLRIVVTREHTKNDLIRASTIIKDLLSKFVNDGETVSRSPHSTNLVENNNNNNNTATTSNNNNNNNNLLDDQDDDDDDEEMLIAD